MRAIERHGIALVATALALLAANARADDPENTGQACVTAYETAQMQQRKGELVAARESLRFCARSVCPVVASADCVKWLGDVERGLPSIVVGAHSGLSDVVDVVVTVDDKELTRRLDGQPLDLDPGSHLFRFTMAGKAPVDMMLVIKVGEKNRVVDVRFDRDAAPPADAPPPTPPIPVADPGKGQRTAAFIVGGVSIAALAAGTVFGFRAIAKNKDADRACPDDECASTDALDANRSARTAANIANVGIGVGLVGLGIATYLFATAPVRVAPYAGKRDAGLVLEGTW